MIRVVDIFIFLQHLVLLGAGSPGPGTWKVFGMSADRHFSGCRKGGEICEQLRALGASLDWDRECFTMDAVSVLHHGPCGCWRGMFRDMCARGACWIYREREMEVTRSLKGRHSEKGLLDVDTQVILGLLSGCDRSFCAALQCRIVVPEPSACQLVVCFKISYLGY